MNSNNQFNSPHRVKTLEVAPMMKISTGPFRYLLRLISKDALLYTEMIIAAAIIKGKRLDFLHYDEVERPLVVQFAGTDGHELSQAAKIAEDMGYNEINLNIGCPSPNVTKGNFGLCQLKTPLLVAEIISQIKSQVKIPISVKTRIGVDELNSIEHLSYFTKVCNEAGASKFIIHARPGLLNYSPAKNLSTPALDFERVYELKRRFPSLQIILNGGLNIDNAKPEIFEQVDGLMFGREIGYNPMRLSAIEKSLFNKPPVRNFEEVWQAYFEYFLENLKPNRPKHKQIQPMLAMLNGVPNSKNIRRELASHQTSSFAHLAQIF